MSKLSVQNITDAIEQLREGGGSQAKDITAAINENRSKNPVTLAAVTKVLADACQLEIIHKDKNMYKMMNEECKKKRKINSCPAPACKKQKKRSMSSCCPKRRKKKSCKSPCITVKAYTRRAPRLPRKKQCTAKAEPSSSATKGIDKTQKNKEKDAGTNDAKRSSQPKMGQPTSASTSQ